VEYSVAPIDQSGTPLDSVGEALRLESALIEVDLRQIEAALARGDYGDAALAAGPFWKGSPCLAWRSSCEGEAEWERLALG
jgi:hypothetical protein